MVTFFIVTLGISIAGMISLLVLKRYELNTGRIFLAPARPRIGEFFHHKLTWVEYILPGLVRVVVRRLYRTGRLIAHAWAAWLVVKLEHMLEQALRTVRHTTTPPRGGERSSHFFRQVAEHKKRLQDDLPDRSTVLEE